MSSSEPWSSPLLGRNTTNNHQIICRAKFATVVLRNLVVSAYFLKWSSFREISIFSIEFSEGLTAVFWKVNWVRIAYEKISVLPSHQRTKMIILIPCSKWTICFLLWCLLVWKQKFRIFLQMMPYFPKITIMPCQYYTSFTSWKT